MGPPGQHQMNQFNHHNVTRPHEPPEQISGMALVRLSNANYVSNAHAMAPPSHQPEMSGLANNSHRNNGYGTQPRGQMLLDNWTAVPNSGMQQENSHVASEDSRVVDVDEAPISSQEVQQSVAEALSQNCQQFMHFLKDWAKQFKQHRLVSKVAELERELEHANERNQQLHGEYERMRAECRTTSAKLGEANLRLDQALRERDEQRRLADGGTLANSAKATDDAIIDKWKLLDYNIRTLAHALAKNPPGLPFDDVAVDRLSSVSPAFRKHLMDEDYRELVLQGYLWTMVSEIVFEAGFCVWGGPALVHLKTVRGNVIDRAIHDGSETRAQACQQAARWSAQGSGLLNQLWGGNPGGVRALANIETRRMRPLFPKGNGGFDRADKKVWDEIRGIIESAAELDQMLMGSKAIFQVLWKDDLQNPSTRPRFNAGAMDVVCCEKDPSPKSLVKMVISPFLYKLGNADGQSYDYKMLLAKASVVCD